jgi:hypothetical protein
MKNKILTCEALEAELEAVRIGIKAEYVNAYISTLGGRDNASIMIKLSLDKPDTWTNGIFENSQTAYFSIDLYGTIENFNGRLPHIRQKNIKTLQEAIEYINTKIRGEK